MSKPELIGGKYYLIDEEKCLYRSTADDGIYYREKGGRMFSRQNPTARDDLSDWAGAPVAFTKS